MEKEKEEGEGRKRRTVCCSVMLLPPGSYTSVAVRGGLGSGSKTLNVLSFSRSGNVYDMCCCRSIRQKHSRAPKGLMFYI